MQHYILSCYQSPTWKLFVYRLVHTQFPLFSNTLLPQKISANWTFFVLLCYAKITQFTAIEMFEKNGRPNQPKACCLWPTYRLTCVSVNTPSNSSQTQSQTKIFGTLKPNAGFFLLVPPLSLSKLLIAVQSPNLVHQHWGNKETQKCPNNFDWDCSTNCYVLYLKSLGNHHHKSPYKDLNAEHIIKESVFTGHHIFVQIIIIWIMLIIIIIRMVGITLMAHQ